MRKLFTLLLITYASVTKAQTPCDSLDIQVHYYPFSDTLIQVDVINHAQQLFSYPIFTMYNSNGDTVALETLNFFGIGSQSNHVMNVFPGMITSNTFTGTLTLYYQTIDSYAVCTYNMNFDLCPDTCTQMRPYMVNTGTTQVYGDASWKILDENGQSVASGVFTLDTNVQYAIDSVCLGAGNYTMKVTDVSLTVGGQRRIGMTTNMLPTPSPDTTFNNVDSTALPFTLYESCFTPSGVKDNKLKISSVNIYSFEHELFINDRNDAIGNITVYSIDGKKVIEDKTVHDRYSISLSSTGLYIVRVMNKNGTTVKKVFIQ